MAFRAGEAAAASFEYELRYLTKSLPEQCRPAAKNRFTELVAAFGPVVDGYPSWHPLVAQQRAADCPVSEPSELCGYVGLDHTVLFRNGFVTCPYSDGADVLASVEKLPRHPLYTIQAVKLDAQLYAARTTAILVECDWAVPLLQDGTIPLRIAAGLLLEQELSAWTVAQCAETWDTMRPYFLGTPCGKRSSLFINEKTGQALKRLWHTIVATEIFGPQSQFIRPLRGCW